MKKEQFDKSWSLFLDRDGVINKEILNSYVTSWEEFQFEDKAIEAIRIANEIFGHLFIVTNQRGVGRGIMSLEDLRIIHTKMNACIHAKGGSIDKVYAAIAVDENDHNRKPNIGMGLQAHEDYPEIDFKKSVMIGNSKSDMEFGRRLGMHNIFIQSKMSSPDDEGQASLVDETFTTLFAWAKSIQQVPQLDM